MSNISFLRSQRSLMRLLSSSLFLLASRVLPVQAQDSTLTRFVRQHHYALTQQGAQFSGPGWERLRPALQQSHFVVVGEEHGLAQIPLFTAAVAQVFKPAVFVAEIDPYVAQTLTHLTAQPGLPTAYERQYPEALCFYDMQEEYELARALRQQQVRLVGIDQVYGSTAAPFYKQLGSLVKNSFVKAYLNRQASRYQRQQYGFEQAGQDEWVMEKQSLATVDSLLLLTKTESPAVRQMAQAYATSYAIYKSQSHQARLNLMKRNLLQEFSDGKPAPRMLFKLGANHGARGLSPATFGEFYDVGNLVQNMADSQDQKSLHLCVIGRQGTQATGTNPFFPAKSSRRYTAADKAQYKVFLDQATGPDWLLVDLRPARRALTSGKLQVSDVALQRTILGYDYVVVIPETTASRPM